MERARGIRPQRWEEPGSRAIKVEVEEEETISVRVGSEELWTRAGEVSQGEGSEWKGRAGLQLVHPSLSVLGGDAGWEH